MDQRGLVLETIREFGIGFAESNSLKGLKRKHLDELKDRYIINDKGNEIYWNRLTFPIKNELGQIVGFNGRKAYDEKDLKTPKYLLPKANDYFSKTNTVYNLDKAKEYIKKEGYVYIVEGIFDVMSFHQQGIKNVVATLGTELSQQQLKLITEYTDNFILAYDGDIAGFTANLETGKLISEFMQQIDLTFQAKEHIAIVKFDEGKDAADYIKTPIEFEKVINEVYTFTSFCNTKFNLEDPDMKEKYIKAYSDFKEKVAKPVVCSKRNTPSKLTQEVMARVNIVDIVEKYASDDLIKRGKNYVTRCVFPDHEDEKPSFNIMPEKNIFKCFSCRKSGNVIHLVAEMEKVSYLEARDMLRKDYQIEGFENTHNLTDDFNFKVKQELLEFTQGYYQYYLKNYNDKTILKYLNSHDILLEDINQFGVGYAPEDGSGLAAALENNGYSLTAACELGLLRQTADGYEATNSKGLTLARKNEFGRLDGFEQYCSKDIVKLKEVIEMTKSKNLESVLPMRMDIAKQQKVIAR